MIDPRKLSNVMSRWPISVVAIGVILTLVWIAIILWIPVRLLLPG